MTVGVGYTGVFFNFQLGHILLVGKYYIFHENDQKKFLGSKKKKCPFKIQDGAQNQDKIEKLSICMKTINFREKSLCTVLKSIKNATISFFTQPSSSNGLEDITCNRPRTGVA